MRASCLVVLVVGVAFMCGGRAQAADDELATVEGKVTYKGQPLTDATITFHLKDDQFVGAKIKGGKYRVDRVPVGEFTVTFESMKFPLPARHSDPEKSSLKLTTQKGKNAADFNLE